MFEMVGLRVSGMFYKSDDCNCAIEVGHDESIRSLVLEREIIMK